MQKGLVSLSSLTKRIPNGESWRHRALNPSRGIDPVLPTHFSPSHPTPVVRLTFSRSVSWDTKVLACHVISTANIWRALCNAERNMKCTFSYACAQSPNPSPHGAGYLGGEVAFVRELFGVVVFEYVDCPKTDGRAAANSAACWKSILSVVIEHHCEMKEA